MPIAKKYIISLLIGLSLIATPVLAQTTDFWDRVWELVKQKKETQQEKAVEKEPSLGVAPLVFVEAQGGTGTSTPYNLLYGNSGTIESVAIGANLTLTNNVLSASAGAIDPFTWATYWGRLAMVSSTNAMHIQEGYSASSTSYFQGVSTTVGIDNTGYLVQGGDITPDTNNALNIGAYGSAWKNLFSSSTAHLDYVSSTVFQAGNGSLAFPALNNGGANGVLFTSNQPAILQGGNYSFIFGLNSNISYDDITPISNNALDLGAFGTSWQNIFASSTSYLDYVSSTQSEIKDTAADQKTFLLLNNDGAFAAGEPTIDWYNSVGDIITARLGSIPGAGYAASAFTIDVSDSAGNLQERLKIDKNGLVELGQTSSTLFSANEVWFGETATSTFGTDGALVMAASINSDTNNTDDLGSFGLAWKNIYASSTAYLDFVSSTMIDIGSGTASGAQMGTAGDLFVSDDLEVDGRIYVDSDALFGDNDALKFGGAQDSWLYHSTTQTEDSLFLGVGAESDALVFAQQGDRTFDFSHPDQNNPTIFVHSANQDTHEYISISHDQTNAVIGTGAGNLVASSTAFVGSANGTSNNGADLGAWGSAWQNIYASSTAHLDYVSSTVFNASGGSTSFPAYGNGGDDGMFFTSNQPAIVQAGNYSFIFGINSNISYDDITPVSNNGFDLGAFGTAWRNIYASSTAYLDYVSSTVMTATSLPNSTQSNTLCYNTTSGEITYVAGDACSSSLLRYKENVKKYGVDMEKLMKLEPVVFNWKNTDKEDFGLIADDATRLFPEIGTYKDSDGSLMGVNYSKLGVILLDAVQNIWNTINSQDDRIEALEARIEQLEQSNNYCRI